MAMVLRKGQSTNTLDGIKGIVAIVDASRL